MKELTIEGKSTRYDQAIKVAKSKIKNDKDHVLYEDDIIEIFPELKQSEDEKMLNQLHSWMKEFGGAEEYTEKVYQWIKGLLEKQGEHAKFCDSIQVGDKVTRNKDGVLVNLSQLNRVAKKDEKQGKNNMGISEATKQKLEDNLNKALEKETPESWNKFLDEQKPADSVEPKFKVGDIVKHKDNPYLTYILKRFTDDGDYEFHAIGKDGHEGCTCFSVVKYQDNWELVEQKPTVEMKTPEESLGIDSDTYNKIVDECVYGEQNPAWSEEDENILNTIINHFKVDIECTDEDDMVRWLKSLRPQNWKPSEGHLKALEDAMNKYHGSYSATLCQLYGELEKLKK